MCCLSYDNNARLHNMKPPPNQFPKKWCTQSAFILEDLPSAQEIPPFKAQTCSEARRHGMIHNLPATPQHPLKVGQVVMPMDANVEYPQHPPFD